MLSLNTLKKFDVVTFDDGEKVVVLSRLDRNNRKFVYVNEILPDESNITDVYKVMEIHLEDDTLEEATDVELLHELLPLFYNQLEE